MELFCQIISGLLGIPERQISNTPHLLDEGVTIPFISHCRKEVIDELDEIQIENIKEQHDKLCDVAKRKEAIFSTVDEQGKLTPEPEKYINTAWNPTELEDICLPRKSKWKIRAEAARQRGLGPLTMIMILQRRSNLTAKTATFVKGDVKDTEDALKDARDIIAEQVDEDEYTCSTTHNQLTRQTEVATKIVEGKEEEAAKYRDHFNFSEPPKRCTSHRPLAIRRTESKGSLKVPINPDNEACLERLDRRFVHGNNECNHQIREATTDVYKRLLKPSIETEFAAQSKEKADDEATRVFTESLRQLLLSLPLRQKRVLVIDPGFRTGCKVIYLDTQGNLLHNEDIYSHPPVSKTGEAASKLREIIGAHKTETISIGNGTASRETENFIGHQTFNWQIPISVVSEQGTSVYSASEIVHDESPDCNVTVRGAVSIGRRLMDPLAGLVKIDLKSIDVR